MFPTKNMFRFFDFITWSKFVFELYVSRIEIFWEISKMLFFAVSMLKLCSRANFDISLLKNIGAINYVNQVTERSNLLLMMLNTLAVYEHVGPICMVVSVIKRAYYLGTGVLSTSNIVLRLDFHTAHVDQCIKLRPRKPFHLSNSFTLTIIRNMIIY